MRHRLGLFLGQSVEFPILCLPESSSLGTFLNKHWKNLFVQHFLDHSAANLAEQIENAAL